MKGWGIVRRPRPRPCRQPIAEAVEAAAADGGGGGGLAGQRGQHGQRAHRPHVLQHQVVHPHLVRVVLAVRAQVAFLFI